MVALSKAGAVGWGNVAVVTVGGGQKVQISSYKINISHADVMYSMVTIVNNTVLPIYCC